MKREPKTETITGPWPSNRREAEAYVAWLRETFPDRRYVVRKRPKGWYAVRVNTVTA